MSGTYAVGDIYEDCNYHPVLCTEVDEWDGVWGISLIDGTYPRGCSTVHCGLVKLTVAEAWEIRRTWPRHLEVNVLAPQEEPSVEGG